MCHDRNHLTFCRMSVITLNWFCNKFQSYLDVKSIFLNICRSKGGWGCHFQVGFREGWLTIFCGFCYRSRISWLSQTLVFVYLKWRFDLAAVTFLRTANVSRAGHANDERGLHTLWHLSAQNLHFLPLSICPSHFTVGQFTTVWVICWYLQWALQALPKFYFPGSLHSFHILRTFSSNLASEQVMDNILNFNFQ